MRNKLLYLIVILAMLVGAIPAAIPAAADDGGSISGYVYEENGTTPIEGATVSAWDHEELLPAFLPALGLNFLGDGLRDALDVRLVQKVR